MPLVNIVDRRKNTYVWDKITAIFEPACHDNHVKYEQKTLADVEDSWSYQELAECTLTEAVVCAFGLPGQTTLYLYDLGDGINIVGERVNVTA